MFVHEICKTLEMNKVPYAIVGGYAVALHGVVRGTIGIDFIIRWKRNNLIHFEKALSDVGLASQLPIEANDIFDFRDEYIQQRNLIMWSFNDSKDLSRKVNLLIPYDLKNFKTKVISTSSGKIKILSRKDLIQMKRESGLPQDLIDLRALEEVL